MIRVITISLILTFAVLTGVSQVSYTHRALKAYQAKEHEVAKAYIDTAITVPAENNDAQTWLIRGYVYLELYKEGYKDEPRPVAEEAFKRVLQLDPDGDSGDRAKKGLYNLAVSYYNVAVNSMNDKAYMEAEPNYKKYRELVKIARPKTDLGQKDIQFYNALGSLMQAIYTNNKKSKPELWDRAMENFQKTFTIDSTNRSANYHIAILYYNKGVDLILSLPPDAPLDQIFEIQDKTGELFLKSRPYMLRAYYLDPKNEDVLMGLKGIYYELNDKEQIEFWDNKLKELRGEE